MFPHIFTECPQQCFYEQGPFSQAVGRENYTLKTKLDEVC